MQANALKIQSQVIDTEELPISSLNRDCICSHMRHKTSKPALHQLPGRCICRDYITLCKVRGLQRLTFNARNQGTISLSFRSCVLPKCFSEMVPRSIWLYFDAENDNGMDRVGGCLKSPFRLCTNITSANYCYMC